MAHLNSPVVGSISSKISSLGGRIITEVGDGIMLNSHNRTQHNLSFILPAMFLVLIG
jgi:hypothetical protein